MLATIENNRSIYLDQVTPDVEVVIDTHFSAKHPKAYYLRTPEWDGWIRKYNKSKRRLALPFLDELVVCTNKYRIPLEIQDNRSSPVYLPPDKSMIKNDLLDGVVLDDYQVMAVRACCDKEVGIIKAVTGAGKSLIMCGIVKVFHCPTVIITEQLIVLNQLVDHLRLRNVVRNNDIGLFCYGNMPDNNLVVIGSIQSLSTPSKLVHKGVTLASARARFREWVVSAKKNGSGLDHLRSTLTEDVLVSVLNGGDISKLDLEVIREYCGELKRGVEKKAYKTRFDNSGRIQDIVGKADLILVDEADLATTNQYSRLFKGVFTGRRRYGFSGTPFDKSNHVRNLCLRENLGNVIFEATRDEVQACDRIIPVKIYFIVVGESNKRDCRAYDIALKEDVVENVQFHEIVRDVVNNFSGKNLVLIDTAPIGPLGEGLERLIPNSKFIYGETSLDERLGIIKKFEDKEIGCLIGSKILCRGFDLKGGLDNMFIIGGGANWRVFSQKIGRALRINDRGWANVFSFYFQSNKYLYRHSRENLKAAVSLGYNVKVITDSGKIDGEKFLKSFRFYQERRV